MSSTNQTSTIHSSQALRNENGDGNPQTSSHRLRQCREFVERYRQLPSDFLRLPGQLPESSNLSLTARTIIAEQGPLVDMIDISVVEAQLVKNYGLLRMDLYCKIRVGHMVCETQTCQNGAKNPKWDGVYQFSLKPGIDSFHLEIYDEKQFSLDEKIAWLYEPIPAEIFQGITVERWFPLSGRLGPHKEGSILLVLSHKRLPIRASNFGRAIITHPQHAPLTTGIIPPPGSSSIFNPSVDEYPTYVQPQPPQPTPTNPSSERSDVIETRQANEDDINQLSEMFPAIDKKIIKAVLENHNNDKEASIGALLAMG